MRNSMVGVLTYQATHRKTWDTLLLLKAQGYQHIAVFAVPFHYKKLFSPFYRHRPELIDEKRSGICFDTKVLCRNLDYEYVEIENVSELSHSNIDTFLVCGAGILPDSFIQEKLVINAHPGYLPYARGLDALKWAIMENLPLGVTTHIIGDVVDAGEIIQRVKIPLFERDTFFEVAQRQYDYEISLLVAALEHLQEKHQYVEPLDEYPLHRRMPEELEMRLLEQFEIYKRTRQEDMKQKKGL